MLEALTRALDWVWITGNHDEELPKGFGGTILPELRIGGVILRHEARTGETAPELSGHYHPKLRVNVRNRHIARPCAVMGRSHSGAERMILPAFGSLTGGLDANHPEILGALQPAAKIAALMPAAGRIARFPLWQAAG
jgi:metallophosphoesterase superfamily enzyme